MSLEAVPCVLKQSDGSPVYGLLIRPVGAPPPPLPPRGPKPLLPAPPPAAAAAGQEPTSSKNGNVFIPATAVQAYQAERQGEPAPQVVPQLGGPPPSFGPSTSAEGGPTELTTLLEDIGAAELASILGDPERHGLDCALLDGADFASTSGGFALRPPCRYQQEPSPRPQLHWERPAPPDASAATPDSGIQSISGGSPASFSPQLAPPPPPAAGEELWDMPRLQAEAEVEEERAEPEEEGGVMETVTAAEPPPIGDKVESMDARFEQVCLRVLKGEATPPPPPPPPPLPPPPKKSRRRKTTTAPTPAAKGPPLLTEAANQTSASPTAAEKSPAPDPKTLVESLLNQLEPTQLQQFTKIFEEKIKASRAPSEEAVSSGAEILKRRRERAAGSAHQLAIRRKLEAHRRRAREVYAAPEPPEIADLDCALSGLASSSTKPSSKPKQPKIFPGIPWARLPCNLRRAAEQEAALEQRRLAEEAERRREEEEEMSFGNLEEEAAEESDGGPLGDSPPQLTPPPMPRFETPVKGASSSSRKGRPSLRVRLSLEGLILPKTVTAGELSPPPRLLPSSLPPKKRLKARLAPSKPAPAPQKEKRRGRRRKAEEGKDAKDLIEEEDPDDRPLSSIAIKPNLIRKCSACKAWTRAEKREDGLRRCADCEEASTSATAPKTTTATTPKRYLDAGLNWSPALAPQTFCPGLHVEAATIPEAPTDFRLPFPLWREKRSSPVTPPKRQKKGERGGKRRWSGGKEEIPSRIPCRCAPASACGPDCLNRICFTECDPEFCPCGAGCGNQGFRLGGRLSDLEKFDTGTPRGFGVRAKVRLEKGAFLCEYVGKHVSSGDFAERMATVYKAEPHHFALSLDSGTLIDAYKSGNVSRFVNHSCRPNCEMQKWSVGGAWRMGLFALDDVRAGEELTYDYKFRWYGATRQACLCGAPECRGAIGAGPKAAPFPPPPMGMRERVSVAKSRRFLLRNYERIRKARLRSQTIRHGPKATLEEDKRAALAIALGHVFETFLGPKGLSSELELRPHLSEVWGPTSPKSLASVQKLLARGHYESPAPFLRDLCALLKKAPSSARAQAAIRLRVGLQTSRLGELGWEAEVLERTVGGDVEGGTNGPDQLLTTASDLSYLDPSPLRVGAYDPDAAGLPAKASASGEDEVRCPCGAFEEDGGMVACDACAYWQHLDCVGAPKEGADYLCPFCVGGSSKPAPVDVRLNPQPTISLKGCTYFKALRTPAGLQLRVGEAVYVERLIGEAHKATLRRLHSECVEEGPTTSADGPTTDGRTSTSGRATKETPTPPKKRKKGRAQTFSRHDLRIFRVERLFTGPQGLSFVFGWYYARPHETFCEPSRRFHRSELFSTPLYDTLPLGAVAGRAAVLDAQTYAKGRPRVPLYDEADVYICELRVDKAQRLFEKVGPKSRNPIVTADYVFRTFESKLKLRRNFTPFVYPDGSGTSEEPRAPISDPLQLGKMAKSIKTEQLDKRKRHLERVVTRLAKSCK